MRPQCPARGLGKKPGRPALTTSPPTTHTAAHAASCFPEPSAHLTDLVASCTHVRPRPKRLVLQESGYSTLFFLPISRIPQLAHRRPTCSTRPLRRRPPFVANFSVLDAASCYDLRGGTYEAVMVRRIACAAPHASPVAILALVAQRDGQLRAVICSLLARAGLYLSCNR